MQCAVDTINMQATLPWQVHHRSHLLIQLHKHTDREPCINVRPSTASSEKALTFDGKLVPWAAKGQAAYWRAGQYSHGEVAILSIGCKYAWLTDSPDFTFFACRIWLTANNCNGI